MTNDEDAPGGWPNPPVILADLVDSVGFHDGLVRVLLVAWAHDSAGEKVGCVSGQLAMTPAAALDLRSKLDQLLTGLDAKGVIALPRGKPNA